MRRPSRPTRRAGQRGQTLVIVALGSILLFGATAMAVDLSLQTHLRRDIQNVTDAASLAGAQELIDATQPAATVQAARQKAAVEAIKVLHNRLQFSISASPNWAANLVQSSNCTDSSSACYVDNLQLTDSTGAGPNDITVSIDTPPKTTQQYGSGAFNGNSQYIEVTARRISRNGFGGVIGFGTSTEGGHSVAFHQPPNSPFGFALYANSVVTDGNEYEIVSGDVYSGRNINPQSNGHASFCAQTQAGGSGGSIVLGAPQGPPSVDDGLDQWELANNYPQDPDTVHLSPDNCATNLGSSTVSQSSSAAASGACPSTIKGVNLSGSSATWNSGIHACVATPALTPPNFAGPNYVDPNPGSPYCGGTFTPGLYQCSGSNQSALVVTQTLSKGVYHIAHNANCKNGCTDVTIASGGVAADGSAGNCPSTGYDTYLCGVTFVLDQGATIGVSSGIHVAITPFIPANPKGNDGRFPIYSPANVTGASFNISNTNTTVTLTGTLYMPNGAVNVGQNAFIFVDGQAIADTWNVQSGNHPNPDISYDAARDADFLEILQLVE